MVEIESENDVEDQIKNDNPNQIEEYLKVDQNEYINNDEYWDNGESPNKIFDYQQDSASHHIVSPIMEDQWENDETQNYGAKKLSPMRGYNSKLYPYAMKASQSKKELVWEKEKW